ncbi:hypothetical protein [Azospirillum himalayense]|uniref:U-box domain-containing protein n=1 Tax=Azospirillum himalayense TaxID=654847 RepID=A0ABW0GEM9_9PROT
MLKALVLEHAPDAGRDLGEPIVEAEIFSDFHDPLPMTLCPCPSAMPTGSPFSNSSFIATMLNRNAGGFHRPDPTRRDLAPL